MEQAGEEKETKKDKQTVEEEDIDENRLYIMNLPFSAGEDELRSLFGKFGSIEEVSLPLGRGGQPLGYSFIRFEKTDGAVSAFANLDKKFF
jgi:multiple RNA-binding domain-containing protein 1